MWFLLNKTDMSAIAKFITSFFSDYSSNSSIHGVRYIGERKLSRVQRLWWIVAFLISLLGSSHLIQNIWKKWEESPVIVSIDDTQAPIWKIPFPAVTMCVEQKFRKGLMGDWFLLSMIDQWTPEENKTLYRHPK